MSVVTLGELHLGVLSGPDEATRLRRGDTLSFARTFEPIPIVESVMETWSRIVFDCRTAGIHRTVKLTNALIAATAVDLGLPVVTQDADFDLIARTHGPLRVLRV